MNASTSSESSAWVDTDLIWHSVAQSLERFLIAWDQDDPPGIREYLPERDHAARRDAIIELIKIDLERRRSSGHPVHRLAWYAEQFPELVREGELPPDLLYEEYHVLRDADATLSADRFADDYPTQRGELRRMLQDDGKFQTTSFAASRRPIHVQPGDVVSDFELLTKLGEGAFATVFLARQQSMQRLVAVKLSTDHGREPQMLAKLDHPHIVRVHDHRMDETRGIRVLYMEYLPAGTLQCVFQRLEGLHPETWSGATLLDAVDSILEERGVHPAEDSRQRELLRDKAWWEVVCLIGSQLADALEHAHGMEVLHRDIKPANVLLTDSAIPKMADFNVSSCSKVAGASPAAFFGGSLAYMSPEHLQASSPKHERSPDDLDGRSDIYGLGVLLWEMLTGKRPFSHCPTPSCRSMLLDAICQHRLQGITDADWKEVPVNCPPGLRSVLAKCLEPDREERYQTAEQLADRLRLCLNPQAESLLTERTFPRRLVSRFPLIVLLLTLMLPNGLAAWFNYDYNYQSIVKPLDANPIFQKVQLWINGTAFPLGIIVGCYLICPVTREVRRRARGEPQQMADDAIRYQSLRIGNRLAWLGLIEWLVAAVAYPIGLHIGGAPLSMSDQLHFFGSLVICGLIAATYPFFGTTAIVVDAWYPLLLRPLGVPKADVASLRRLERLSWRYLILAGTIPLLALMVLSSWGRAENRTALIILSAGGLGLFAITFGLAQMIQSTLRTLADTARELKRE